MQKIKIIKRLMDRSEANQIVSYERSMARKQGKGIKKVEVVCAVSLYKTNKNLFNNIGKPWAGDLMVIVYYTNTTPQNLEMPKTHNTIELKAKGSKQINTLKPYSVLDYKTVSINGIWHTKIERRIISGSKAIKGKVIPLNTLDYQIAA